MWSFEIGDTNEKVVHAVLSCVGSLHTPRFGGAFERLIGRLAREESGAGDAARLVEEAVPQERFPHPQRAIILEAYSSFVAFETPGGVEIGIGQVPDTDNLYVRVNFNRDSCWLAYEMLTAVTVAAGSVTYPVVEDYNTTPSTTTAGAAIQKCIEALLNDSAHA